MVVLVDEHTASSGEIVAGALKDNGRAELVGTRTFGKGSVQLLLKLGGGSGAIKLTSSFFYLPSGRSIDRRSGEKTWGVDPTDGDYIPLDHQQEEALARSLQERGLLGKKVDPAQKLPKVTPKSIAEDYSDPQLAGALKAMIAKLQTGEFVKVGKSNATLLAHLARREEIQRRKEALEKNLEQLNKDLAAVDKAIGEEEKKP
jgi:carboxyl-terminal processing protease